MKAPDYTLEPGEPVENPALAAALEWAAAGWPVFPLRSRDKIPAYPSPHKKGTKCDGRCGLVGHGVLDASTDPDKIRRLFAPYPNANIGGATTGRLAVDLDLQSGGHAVDALPETRTHLSGRGNGNEHRVYRLGGSLGQQLSQGHITKGVDFKSGPGAYVVLPGSLHPETGKPYTVANPQVPERVLTDDEVRGIWAAYGQMAPGERKTPDSTGERVSRDLPDGGALFRKPTLAELLRDAPARGDHLTNDWLASVAGHYALLFRNRRADYEFHVRDAAARVDPQYEDTEKVLESVWGTEQANPDRMDADPTAWEPLDLASVVQGLVTGTRQRIRPTLGTTTTGDALFYAGRVNGVAGASGDGKSWVALHVCAQALAAGESAFYIDYEDSEDGVVTRLLQLGADPQAVVERFVYRNPDVALGDTALAELLAHVEVRKPTVVVFDSTGEALAAEGINPNADEEVARWFQRVARAVAKAGPAVVLLDHLVKSPDGGLWPAGSQRKRAAISGAQYIQSVTKGEGFSERQKGRAKLVCAKDRPGRYYQGELAAYLEVTPMTGHGHDHLLGSVLAELVTPTRVPEVPAEEAEALRELGAREARRHSEGMDTQRVAAFVQAGDGRSKNSLEAAFQGVGKTPLAKDGKQKLGRMKVRALVEQAVGEGLVHWTGSQYALGAALDLGEADQ